MPTSSYKEKVFDARPDRLDLRDREYRPPLKSLPAQWPTEDLIQQLLPCYTRDGMILDQGKEGACTGFGLAAVINYLIWREAVELTDNGIVCPDGISEKKVSKRMLYNMARVYDEWEGEDYEGSSCRGAMKGWHRHGVCTDKSWPYSSNKKQPPEDGWAKEATQNPLGAYYRINKDSVVDMQAAILEVGAIYCSAAVHQGWWLKSQDALSKIKRSNKIIGGHAFALIGYTDEGFIIQNSWGEDWGFYGFALLTFEDWVENGSDAWVAVRGAPISHESPPLTYSNHSLQSIATDSTQRASSSIRKAINYPYTKADIAPWPEDEAYKHSLVIGNDGRPKLTMLAANDRDESAWMIAHDHIQKWLSANKQNKKIVIYAHGGLNSEKDSINRIRIMAPYFKANGIYPLFITWKTGFMESISSQLNDQIKGKFLDAGIDPASAKAQGIFNKMRNAIDSAIEKFSKHLLVRGVWTEMKENAQFASDRAVRGYPQQGSNVRPGGMVILSKALKQLAQDHDYEIHLVGHSAGSILFGHWLDELVKRKLPVNSTTLYAPACTVEFANKHYINAHNKGILDKKNLHIHMMDDERELADSVGKVYGKSLLYLVSRALEDVHKMPLLGMAAAWDDENAHDEDGKFNTSQLREIEKWITFANTAENINICTQYSKTKSQVKTSLKNDHIELSHGSFDNDIKLIEKTIKQIAEKDKLKFRVENLSGF